MTDEALARLLSSFNRLPTPEILRALQGLPPRSPHDRRDLIPVTRDGGKITTRRGRSW